MSVGVVGAGTMGRGIAAAFLYAGYRVKLYDKDQLTLERAVDYIKAIISRAVEKGRHTPDEAAVQESHLLSLTNVGELAEVDLCVEAAFESMPVKKAIFVELDEVCRPDTLIATNTSFLDVNALAQVTRRPDAVLGLHFFNPAHIMPLLEIVRGRLTSKLALATAIDIAHRLKKTPVIAGVGEGFIANRMAAAYFNEAQLLLLQVGSPDIVDRAVVKFGFPMGPFALMDLGGLDVFVAALRNRGGPDPVIHSVLSTLVERGRFGQKTKAGFYRYSAHDRTPSQDDDVLELAREKAAVCGIKSTSISDHEIALRLVMSLIPVGFEILEEGIAQRASDLDVVFVKGFGFPADKGGPMRWAANMGFPKVVAILQRWQAQLGGRWRVPRTLRELAESSTAG
jgi:3-hydroxyacyl-CoA dehydrogenase